MNKNTLGVLCAASTGLLWALSSPASKLLGESGADMLTVVYWLFLVQNLFYFVYVQIATNDFTLFV